jgi:hypothetical protein
MVRNLFRGSLGYSDFQKAGRVALPSQPLLIFINKLDAERIVKSQTDPGHRRRKPRRWFSANAKDKFVVGG